MMISQQMSNVLAIFIREEIENEFKKAHLSNSLVDTMTLVYSSSRALVQIPAQIYDIDLYVDTGVIVYQGYGRRNNKKGYINFISAGSYASQLDSEGSRFYVHGKLHTPRNHINYIENCISKAIKRMAKVFVIKEDEMEVHYIYG